MKTTIKVSEAGSEQAAWTQATKLVDTNVRAGNQVYISQNFAGTNTLRSIVVEVVKR